jgi:hypothetical protein
METGQSPWQRPHTATLRSISFLQAATNGEDGAWSTTVAKEDKAQSVAVEKKECKAWSAAVAKKEDNAWSVATTKDTWSGERFVLALPGAAADSARRHHPSHKREHLVAALPSATSTAALHGDVHDGDSHARHGNGQRPGATSSLAKNPMKIVFIKIVPVMISVETTTTRGNSDGWWGVSRYIVSVLIFTDTLSFSNHLSLKLIQLHR